MSVLVVAEHNNQQLNPATLNALSAATELSDTIDLLVAGDGCQSVIDQVSSIPCVNKVHVADNPVYGHFLAENIAPLIEIAANGYSYILATATTMAKNIMPRVSALLDVQAISDICAVVSEDTFKRPIYAGNLIATVQSKDAIKVITVRATAFDAVEATGGSAAVEILDSVNDMGISSFASEQLAESDRPELTAANIVVSGGRGMASGDNFDLLYRIADKLGAAVGASRAAVDADYVPNDMQVGQTGKIVAPDLYIAVGISGAIQHLAGMKDSKVIVAINKDEEAPIFSVADYGLVADLFSALPELESKLP
jgi:electron transfer flavoprotein alpha subunit